MKSSNELRSMLRSVDHKSYPAYKSLAGIYQFPHFTLSIDHVQGDPFASPSSLHVEVGNKTAGFPPAYYEKDCSRIALQDHLTRLLISRQRDPAKAVFCPLHDAGRRFWNEAPARSRIPGSSPAFMWGSLLLAVPSTPVSWRRSCSIFCPAA